MSEESAAQHTAEPVEMPRPTTAPLVLALGIVLVGAGVVLGQAMSLIGLVLVVAGLGSWIGQFAPGRGHIHEPRAVAELRPLVIQPLPGTVERLEVGAPGYRLRLPVAVRPISAGIKGGIAGGVIMPVPALLWGLLSGHGLWYPVNLLAGIVVVGVETMTVAELEQFNLFLLLVGSIIHAIMSVAIGLMYGVLLPTLPEIPTPFAWGGLLMPIVWTAVSFSLMALVNPVLQEHVSWPWFILSQFVFGMVLAATVAMLQSSPPLLAGILGGLIGGLLMAGPALLWGVLTHNGIWYPVNLLAGMIVPGMDQLPADQLRQYNPRWLAIAVTVHGALSIGLGMGFRLALPELPRIPAPITAGALLLPLVWSGASYGLMGVVNPLLQRTVDWPWFIVSQFVFGIAAAIVVYRTEKIPVPPAGTGPDAQSLMH